MDLAKTLRSEIEASGKSRYALAKETGVKQSRINGFMAGQDMRLENASKIMTVLGLDIRRKKS